MDTYESNEGYFYYSYIPKIKLEEPTENMFYTSQYDDDFEEFCYNFNPTNSSINSPMNSSVDSYVDSSVDSPMDSSVDSPMDSSVDSPMNSPIVNSIVNPIVNPIVNQMDIPDINIDSLDTNDNMDYPSQRFNMTDIIINPRKIKMNWPIEVLNMGTRDINKYITNHNLTTTQKLQLKQERRRLFNRMYARTSRDRKKTQTHIE